MAEDLNLNLVSAWDAASPLWHAPLHYAPPDLRKAWDELKKRSAMEEAAQSLKQCTDKKQSWFDILGTMAAGANVVLAPRGAVLRDAQALLLADIKAGKMLAFGFEPPRRLQSIPVYIQAKHWNQSVNWDDSTVVSAGLKFVEVRIIPSQIVQTIIDKNIDTQRKKIETLPATPGRPTIQHYVKSAFFALSELGQIDTDRSALSHYPHVNQWIKENTSYCADSLSDEGIRAHFSPLFKELKKNRKQ
jgi:hypothetical protein